MATRSTNWLRALATLIGALLLHLPADAQEAPRPIVAASGRATTGVSFDGRLIGSIWLNRSTSHSGPAWMAIDYGQPHARGREIFGGLVPYGEVWRLGANMATHLTLDLNVSIGDVRIPAGTYSLYLIPFEDRADLVVSRQLRQWGTEYDEAHDFARIPLTGRDLPEVRQSLSIVLEPDFPQAEGTLPAGDLRIAWGEREYSTRWQAVWP